jgi:dTDP-4-dehydrorhamnose 3,5-epimerase
MIFSPTPIKGAYLIDLERRVDERGFFARSWCATEFVRAGLNPDVSQINVSRSTVAGTLRGMHFQIAPHAEVKVVRCLQGAVYDVLLDLRPDSATFKQSYGVELNADQGRALYIPEGCAHGFLTLTTNADLLYQASTSYAPAHARGVRFDDPAFSIEWPRSIEVVSKADREWPEFQSEQGAGIS